MNTTVTESSSNRGDLGEADKQRAALGAHKGVQQSTAIATTVFSNGIRTVWRVACSVLI